MQVRNFRSPAPIDLGFSARELRHGWADPTIAFGPKSVARATRTPDGAATLHLEAAGGCEIEAHAWGPGAAWVLEHAPVISGAADDPRAFIPSHRGLRDLHRRMPGMRFTRSRAIVEALVPTIIEQKVTSGEAHASYRSLVTSFREPAPGPYRLLMPPDPRKLAAMPYEDLHPFGIERKRAEVIRRVCVHASALEEAAFMSPRAAFERLTAVPGVGSWSAANVMQQALGDPDAVLVGDFHMPHLVAWFFAGEARATDRRMLELLEPYRGQRARAMRLITYSGLRAPKFGPRHRLRNIAAI